jgi:GDP-L-fucose synthase
VSIAAFARLAGQTVGYDGRITYDSSELEGTPRKLVDISRLTALGRRGRAPLCAGPSLAYRQCFQAKSVNRAEA